MARNFDAVCIGKTTLDQFLVLDELTLKYHLDPKSGYLSFRHGEKIEVEQFNFCIGGNATNVAIGLSRLGFNATLCSEIGDDDFSGKLLSALAKENIDKSHMIVTRGAVSSLSVILNFKHERTIFMQKVRREHNFKLGNISAKYIFLTSLEEEWRKPYEHALSIVKKGHKLAFNPGTLQLHEGRELVLRILKHTDTLFVNKEEAEEIVWGKEKNTNNEVSYIRELLTKLDKMGPKTVIITNSVHGSHAIDEQGNFYHQGIHDAEVVEKTGAGDAYTSGFLGARLLDKNIKEAMAWGAINSTAVIKKVGATAGLLYRNEMERKLRVDS